jgi:hypothetical protein
MYLDEELKNPLSLFKYAKWNVDCDTNEEKIIRFYGALRRIFHARHLFLYAKRKRGCEMKIRIIN